MRPATDAEEKAAGAVDRAALAADLGALVRARSLPGAERAAASVVVDAAARLGLAAELRVHDLAALRAHPDHPGEEAARTELVDACVTLPGAGPRLCLDGHLDVVDPGTVPWSFDPWGGDEVDGFVRGRGAADMKGGVVAALHAMGAVRSALGTAGCEVVLLAVGAEEDGGLGTFAALERDDRYDACLVPEPTGFAVIAAQAGALTFAGEVPGVSAHAAVRLEGVSAIDRYVPIHLALAEHERQINADVAHPLMRELALPYPILVGRVQAGTWSSQVPDRLRFEGRLGVPVGETPAQARAAFEDVVARACPSAMVRWTGGQFAPAETPVEHPFVGMVSGALEAELGRAPGFAGAPYGSDMRLFCARGIPCVMAGTGGIELAHAVDERVSVDEVVRLARAIARLIVGFG